MIRLFCVAMSDSASAAVAEVLASGYIGQGPKVEAFEQAFSELVGAPYPPLALNSCTSALDLALHLAGVGAGDTVISTPMTCTATNGVIVRRRAQIVWADIDPLTGLIDPDDVKRKMSRGVKAIMAVDWGGCPCDYGKLRNFGVPVIEDAAHALLSTVGGQPLTMAGGDYVCWSFQAIKHLTTGDGGALFPPHDQLERGRLLRWYGLDRRSSQSFRCEQNIVEVGYKYHMNDIAAAIGLSNLPMTAGIVERHRDNARFYSTELTHTPAVSLSPWNPESAWWLYTILVEDRPDFIRYLAEHDIEASPVHARNDKHSAFQYPSGALPGVDIFAQREVAIPVGWWMMQDELNYVCEIIRKWAYRRQSQRRQSEKSEAVFA